MKMGNVTPRIAILALWKAKFSEVGNELLGGHASFLPGMLQTPIANQALAVDPAGLNLAVAQTNAKCYKKDYTYGNTDQPTVPWLQSTRGKAAIAETQT